jgi:insertion element IS1 protein InsB
VPDGDIVQLVTEGVGIQSAARILAISPATVIRRILKIAKATKRPYPVLKGKCYQVDELFTYIGHKNNRVCIAYSLEVESGNVIDVVVGHRNKTNLGKVITPLILSEAQKITTDKLNIYKKLIPPEIHATKFRGINKIERHNLTLRTQLKRLNRRTICYSKSPILLAAIVKIYIWRDYLC